ncbi:hypothetical protein LEP1GSC047_1967 [Leptospira inadai serovar Lyme str. 10]|uniref:Uncharacterized protein n=1 Tax=Leptospira inadai serovar Lyme str. 10 TaxID=1049790 RepID=V6HH48_9LEPT|nr:hypothetical protein LEP1GSC047_1967 [Leptospira inadai serovar Lyme str. 10]
METPFINVLSSVLCLLSSVPKPGNKEILFRTTDQNKIPQGEIT